MKNGSPNTPTANDQLWDIVDRFEVALTANPFAEPDEFLPPRDSPIFSKALTETLRIRLESFWSQGRTDGLADVVQKIPDFAERSTVLASVAFEDFRQRQLAGRPVDPQFYFDVYGVESSNWLATWELTQSRLLAGSVENGPHRSTKPTPRASDHQPDSDTEPARLANTVDALDSGKSVRRNQELCFPRVGSRLGSFEILSELGRGAFGRVYVARQLELAQRLVALKVTAMPFGESQRLAKLQHQNIMPLYSIHHFDSLFGLCMPLLGTVTLKEVIVDGGSLAGAERIAYWQNEFYERYRQHVLKASGNPDNLPALDNPPTRYTTWVFRMIKQLALGLAHAHERRILHRDIKPANVLLAADGTPILLDFNLGREEKAATDQIQSVGGTVSYMAPEHLQAMFQRTGTVDQRADVYSLGVVLYEWLTGRRPFDTEAESSFDLAGMIESRREDVTFPEEFRRLITPAERSIVQKCLAFDKADRYQTARDLAEDIDRHLQSLSVRYARNPSWAERMEKFFNRNWRPLGIASGLVVLVCMVTTLLIFSVRSYRHEQRQMASHRLVEFKGAIHQAEARLYFPEGGDFEPGISQGLQALAIFEIGQNDKWRERSYYPWLDAREQQQVEELGHHLWQLLKSTRQLTKNDLALDGHFSEPNVLPDANREQPLAAATRLYRDRRYGDAIRLLRGEVEHYPDRFAFWFLLGKCYYESRSYLQAEQCYAMASTIDPRSALSKMAQGLCFYSMEMNTEAIDKYQAALSLDQNSTATLFNLALVFERQGRFVDALGALEKALVLKPDTGRFLLTRSRIKRKLGNAAEADADLARLKSLEPSDPEDWVTRGLAWISESPERAAEDFRRATEFSATRAIASQNLAHVLSEWLGKTKDAIAILDELLIHEPEFSQALAGRAVLLARSKQSELALADVEKLLQQDLTPALHYQIACVYSLLSAQEPSLQDRALMHLGRALRPSYGANLMGSDKDLEPIRNHPEFQQMSFGAKTMWNYQQRQLPD